jgi:hypothetical protein
MAAISILYFVSLNEHLNFTRWDLIKNTTRLLYKHGNEIQGREKLLLCIALCNKAK